MIHDKRDTEQWSKDVEPIESGEYSDGDIILGDGYGSFRHMTVVHEIDADAPNDSIVHRGVFWKDEYAEAFAELIDDE